MPNYNYVIGGRGIGKTRKIMELAKEKNAIVICKNPAAMERKAAAYGIFGLKFIGYSDTLINLRTDYAGGAIYPNENFVIDATQSAWINLDINSIISFATAQIKKRKKRFGLFIKTKEVNSMCFNICNKNDCFNEGNNQKAERTGYSPY